MAVEIGSLDDQILSLLKRRPMNLPELISGIPTSANQIETTMRSMVDRGLVEQTSSNDWKIISSS